MDHFFFLGDLIVYHIVDRLHMGCCGDFLPEISGNDQWRPRPKAYIYRVRDERYPNTQGRKIRTLFSPLKRNLPWFSVVG